MEEEPVEFDQDRCRQYLRDQMAASRRCMTQLAGTRSPTRRPAVCRRPEARAAEIGTAENIETRRQQHLGIPGLLYRLQSITCSDECERESASD